MAVTIFSMTQPVVQLLGNRSDAAVLATQAIADSVTELSNAYPFEELRETGPLVQFTPGINQYLPTFFMQPTPTGGIPPTWPRVLNKVLSWFLYLSPPTNLATATVASSANAGYNLIFRDIENIEILINTLTLPKYWSWIGANLYVAATPQLAYYTYMRYQFLHNFSFPATSTDPILMPATWYDIIQYAAAERVAAKLRMADVVTRYHQIIFGDPEFERSSGARGQPGLIARRTSQTQKNQSRTTRSITLVRRSY